MEYIIKFINVVGRVSCFAINGYNIKFFTKSERDVLFYLQNMEEILTNNLKFSSIQDLDSDTFRVIEYFAQAYPDMVISYFMKVKEEILFELEELRMRRMATIKFALKYICGIVITDKTFDDEIFAITVNVNYNLKATQRILNDIFHKRNDGLKDRINKSYSASFGTLICLGVKCNSASYIWELNGETNIIFNKADKNIDDLAETKLIFVLDS